MNLEIFITSTSQKLPPDGLSVYLLSLWYDRKADWEQSHMLIQDIDDTKAAHIHAYLHRKEGDLSNARYWYAKAGVKAPNISLDDEWKAIVGEMINAG
jgi:hypothetical protein